MVLYLYQNHYCLINKDNKAKGIEEIKKNFTKIKISCNDKNVKDIKNYVVNTSTVNEDSTFFWDLEGSPNKLGYFEPWAAGIVRIKDVENILGDALNSEENVNQLKLEELNNNVEIFEGIRTCLTDMFKYLGNINYLESATLIAHNGAKFDMWLLLAKSKFKPYKILEVGGGLIEVRYTNPFTSNENQELIKQSFMKKTRKKNLKGDFLQKLIFIDSYKHCKYSLESMCKTFKIPMNLRKSKLDHENHTLENYKSKRDEWDPYLRLDVISAACCVLKYSKVMMDVVGQNMSSCLTIPSLTLKGWFKHLTHEEEEPIHTHTDPYVRDFIRKSIKGGRVFAAIRDFNSPLWNKILEILNKHADPNLPNFTQKGIPELLKWYNMNPTLFEIREEIKNLKQCDDDFLMAFVAVEKIILFCIIEI